MMGGVKGKMSQCVRPIPPDAENSQMYKIDCPITEREVSRLNEFVQRVDVPDGAFMRIEIDSPGGNLASAFAMCDILRPWHSKIETVNVGRVDSAAIAIYSMGSRRVAVQGSSFSFHPVTKMVQGTADVDFARRLLSELEHDQEEFVNAVARRTGIDHGRIQEMMQRCCHVSASQSLEIGLSTEVIGMNGGH